MKTSPYIIAILLLIFCSASAFSQVVYSNDNVDVIQLEKNVYLLKENYQFTANSLVITGDEGLLIIDTGFGEIAADFLDAVSFLEGEVKVIVNSHGHQDHVGANGAFSKQVQVVGHKNCEEVLAQHDQQVVAFNDSYSFDFSGHQVLCTAYPGGHSECDILIHIPDLKLAYLGDYYLSESFPLVIIGAGSSVQKLISNLKVVQNTLPEDTRLFSGHGKVTTMTELGEYMNMLDVTIEAVTDNMEKGKTLPEIQAADVLVNWGEWGKFFPFISKNSWIEQIYLSYQK